MYVFLYLSNDFPVSVSVWRNTFYNIINIKSIYLYRIFFKLKTILAYVP